jgi:hypothetical protein
MSNAHRHAQPLIELMLQVLCVEELNITRLNN